MDSQRSTTSSPSKNQLTSWWKQFKNGPKSISTDSLSVNNHNRTRSRARSSNTLVRNISHDGIENGSANLNPVSDEYRSYRDSFLSNRHDFTGRVFGVSLQESLSAASAEVIVQSELASFGRIPIVVAKCGAFLKSKGLQSSGIFRIAGNNKRVKELQYIFSSPPHYGTKFSNWDEFTVHDAASVLRRYLNNLSEPLIPLDLYEQFREPLKSRPRILKHMIRTGVDVSQEQENAPPHSDVQKDIVNGVEDAENDGDGEEEYEVAIRKRKKLLRHKKRLTRDIRVAIKEYEELFVSLSNDSKQLLVYLLDLLSLFAQQSDANLMTARNLAAIFQPSILSHPRHDMDPKEYELSRLVVEFLIDYSYKLLPHLLKLTKNEQSAIKKERAEEVKNEQTPEQNHSQSIVINDGDEEKNLSKDPVTDVPVTPTQQALPTHAMKYLTPPGPSFLEGSSGSQKLQVPIKVKRRPHSKSLNSAPNPPDMIAGTLRNSRKRPSWLHRTMVSSDTGDFTATEEEEDDDEGSINHAQTYSPLSANSGSIPKTSQFLAVPPPHVSRSLSGNSVLSSGSTQPLSQILNKSIEELTSSLGLRKNNNITSPIPTDDEDERKSRSRNRDSWFQRLRSRSRSLNGE